MKGKPLPLKSAVDVSEAQARGRSSSLPAFVLHVLISTQLALSSRPPPGPSGHTLGLRLSLHVHHLARLRVGVSPLSNGAARARSRGSKLASRVV